MHTLGATKRHESDDGVAVQAVRPELKAPKLYQVVLLNDDYTTMDFVVEVLQRFFTLSHDRAMTVMLQVHTQGRGICGVYTREVAETKVEQVIQYSRSHQHPLLCVMEEA